MNRERSRRAFRQAAPSGPSTAERERIRRSFLAMALAHELKQPLNSLNLNAELLSKRLGRLPSVPTDVDAPLQAIARVVERVTDCLEAFYVRVEPDAVPREVTSVVPILEGAAARAQRAAAAVPVRLSLELVPDLPPLPLHPDQLAVALDALIDNAIQASAPGSDVMVRAHHDDTDLHIDVIDKGDGMSPETARHAVEIGYSTRNADGTGLTIAKFIAYHHFGGFHVETRPGAGTTATMVLPLSVD
ncbi:MAG: HAMP domain-containing histidine kinase [Deltaproteobacteria bacterium]|nr:HAMP domain-containing histidine kinase [Deltaproteobacteria bacterium]